MAICQVCEGTGRVGPVFIDWRGGGEYRESMPCYGCRGSGEWSDARLAAHQRGQAMREARVAAGKSIREAAREMGVSPADLSKMERGEQEPRP